MRGSKVRPEVEVEICRLYIEDGLSTGGVAAKVGLSRATIGAVLKRNGIPQDLRRRGFAVISPARVRSIASIGGKAVPPEKRGFFRNRAAASTSGRKSRRGGKGTTR
jgi:hypothetical protein